MAPAEYFFHTHEAASDTHEVASDTQEVASDTQEVASDTHEVASDTHEASKPASKQAWAASPGPLKGIPKAYRMLIGAMGYRPGPAGAIFTGSGPGFISGAKHDFLYQFFMLIPNF